MALGWSGTQWRQEKELTTEKGEDRLKMNSCTVDIQYILEKG